MCRRALVVFALLANVLITAVFVDTADAQRWWRFRRSYRNYSGGSFSAAPKRDSDSAGYDRLRAYYSYDRARAPEATFNDRIRAYLMIHDDRVEESTDPLIAEVKIAAADNLSEPQVVHVPVSLSKSDNDDYSLGEFEITNEGLEADFVKPATVYRMFVNLHQEADSYDKESAYGRVPSAYYVATSGDSPVEKARHQIVMRTFSEWYCIQCGRRREGGYRMDCHDYYRWALGEVTVGASYNRANLNRIFGGDYRNGGNIKAITEKDSIHGDYVRIPGHTFMLLGYDPKRHRVLTMEGNFNSSIEVAIRPVSSGWTVGHIGKDDIKPELFADESSDEMMAGMEDGSETSGG